MNLQIDLFASAESLPTPAANFVDNRIHPDEKTRLNRQCLAIIKRLLESNATNRELSTTSLKYTSRLSEIRHAGIGIEIITRDYDTGLVTYRIALADRERAAELCA